MTPFRSSDLGENWLSWPYDITPGSNTSEQQQALQRDCSNLEKMQGLEDSNDEPEDWDQLRFIPIPTWPELPLYDGNLEPFVDMSGNHIAEQEISNADRAQGSPQPGFRPTFIATSSPASTTVSADVIGSPGNSLSVSSFMNATTIEDSSYSEILGKGEKRLSQSSTAPSSLSPEQGPTKRRRKRKCFTEVQEPSSTLQEQIQRTVQTARHSICEKRYRTKLNVKLAALRAIVPSLRDISNQSEASVSKQGIQSSDGPVASTKFDKATIISKAIEYIVYLEHSNNSLSSEDDALKDRMSAIQEISMAGSNK